MQAYKCDMCGEYFEYEPAVTIEMVTDLVVLGEVTPRELCHGCWKKVKAFIVTEVEA